MHSPSPLSQKKLAEISPNVAQKSSIKYWTSTDSITHKNTVKFITPHGRTWSDLSISVLYSTDPASTTEQQLKSQNIANYPKPTESLVQLLQLSSRHTQVDDGETLTFPSSTTPPGPQGQAAGKYHHRNCHSHRRRRSAVAGQEQWAAEPPGWRWLGLPSEECRWPAGAAPRRSGEPWSGAVGNRVRRTVS